MLYRLKILLAVSATVAAVVTVSAIGKVHVVRGSAVQGVRVIDKVSWSLSETFVNLDEVGQMPAIFARAQYPLFTAALARQAEQNEGPGVTERNIGRVHCGQRRPEVHGILGQPDSPGTERSNGEVRDYWHDALTGKSLTVVFWFDKVDRLERR